MGTSDDEDPGRMARGGLGLLKVSLGPSTVLLPMGRPPLKQPYGFFRVGRLLSPWTPHAVRL
jgi:hypothetical protein